MTTTTWAPRTVTNQLRPRPRHTRPNRPTRRCALARYYDPATAQFLTRDPLESVTRSAYGYASNDPVNRTDPTGMFDIPSWVPGIGGMCVDINDPGCRSPRDGCSTGLSSAIVNFAGGVLTMNPITAFLPLDLAGHGVDSSSGWYTAGQGSMLAVDLMAGGAALNAATTELGYSQFLFARGTGLLNSNNIIRLGWGWSAPAGRVVFRLVLGSPSSPIHWHFDLL